MDGQHAGEVEDWGDNAVEPSSLCVVPRPGVGMLAHGAEAAVGNRGQLMRWRHALPALVEGEHQVGTLPHPSFPLSTAPSLDRCLQSSGLLFGAYLRGAHRSPSPRLLLSCCLAGFTCRFG